MKPADFKQDSSGSALKMTPSPAQIRQALINTMQQPCNEASLIFQAFRNDKPAEAGSSSPVAGPVTARYHCDCLE